MEPSLHLYTASLSSREGLPTVGEVLWILQKPTIEFSHIHLQSEFFTVRPNLHLLKCVPWVVQSWERDAHTEEKWSWHKMINRSHQKDEKWPLDKSEQSHKRRDLEVKGCENDLLVDWEGHLQMTSATGCPLWTGRTHRSSMMQDKTQGGQTCSKQILSLLPNGHLSSLQCKSPAPLWRAMMSSPSQQSQHWSKRDVKEN